ncbi:MAG: MBL fold metallo-hydrolase [Ignavibacteriales bacterium]
MLKMHRFVFNAFAENTYIISDEESGEAIVVDPGCSNTKEKEQLDIFIRSGKLTLKALVNTHCHIDHILGNAYIKGKYNTQFMAPEEDLFMLDLMLKEAGNMGFRMEKSPRPDVFITEDLDFKLGNYDVKFLFTPGHSPGGYCIYFPSARFCITGDVLFRQGIGRTDLWGGSYDDLISSIETKLFTLPDDTLIFPGHGEESTIGFEKTSNPFLS